MRFIVQIELTNVCNRTCSYCGQTNMTREKGFISDKTIRRCIRVLSDWGQETVGIHHYGESTLHPKLIDYIRWFNDAGIRPWLYTNGDYLEAYIPQLAQRELSRLVVSGHVFPARRQVLEQLCHDAGIDEIELQRGGNWLNLAGQLEHMPDSGEPLADPQVQCRFLAQEHGIVLWNGDLVPCCFDYDGKMIFGNIHDDNAVACVARPGVICASCPGHPGNVLSVKGQG